VPINALRRSPPCGFSRRMAHRAGLGAGCSRPWRTEPKGKTRILHSAVARGEAEVLPDLRSGVVLVDGDPLRRTQIFHFDVLQLDSEPCAPPALGRIASSGNGPGGRRIARRLMTHDGARAHSSLRSALSRSRSSGVSACPCSRMACRTATVRTSSCVPEIASVQFFSLGNRRQSMIFLFGCKGFDTGPPKCLFASALILRSADAVSETVFAQKVTSL